MSENADQNKRLGFFQVLKSVLASFLGVQSDAQRERDFKKGSARDFILIGLIATVLFILIVFAVVQLVVSSVGL